MLSHADQERVDAFVRRHFGFRGSLRLHRAALGWDLLTAPVNVLLAPVFLLSRLMALVLHAVRLRRASAWIFSRPIFFHAQIARVLEGRIEAELWAAAREPGAVFNDRQRLLLRDYTSVRTSVSELFTTLVVLALGVTVFRHATPGIVSLTPLVSDYVAHSSAISGFPLGQGLGRLWYAVFPQDLPLWFVVAVGVALAVAASIVTTFAGLLADPLQAGLGIHRRRLRRLLAKLEAQDDAAPSLAPEHAIARLADLTDAGVSVVRLLRG